MHKCKIIYEQNPKKVLNSDYLGAGLGVGEDLLFILHVFMLFEFSKHEHVLHWIFLSQLDWGQNSPRKFKYEPRSVATKCPILCQVRTILGQY